MRLPSLVAETTAARATALARGRAAALRLRRKIESREKKNTATADELAAWRKQLASYERSLAAYGASTEAAAAEGNNGSLRMYGAAEPDAEMPSLPDAPWQQSGGAHIPEAEAASGGGAMRLLAGQKQRTAGAFGNHNITLADKIEMLRKQSGRCALCRKHFTDPFGKSGRADAFIDHDHSHCSKKAACAKCFRGLLHHACNVVIGLMAEDPGLLTRAVSYAHFCKLFKLRMSA